jgi:tRNA(Ile)-lysidine synthase
LSSLTGADIDALFASVEGYERFGLAVSGGPDSLALMLLAAQWAKGRAVDLFVYTVDHRLRPEAAAEAAMVAREAEALGLDARILHWEGDKPATGIQAAARVARYRLMSGAMAADGVEILLTAHHLGDQAETVLMRLAHGSGIDGLRGMDRLSFVEGCEVARPLLGVRPEVLRQVVSDAGLSAASDPSNMDTNYERVRWRLMLPALEALGLSLERLGVFARRMDEAGSLVHAEVEAHYREIVEPMTASFMRLDARRFSTLNPAVATALLGQVLNVVAGLDDRNPPLGPLELLARRLQQPDPLKGLTLHGCLVSREGESILVRKEGPRRTTRRVSEALTPG